MESLSVSCLLLLLCSLSGAELQDNEVLEQREVGPESVNVPQPCPSDVQAVLREMSVKLARHEVKMEQLQTLNQEQSAKLAKYEAKMEQLQTHDQEQNAKLVKYEVKMEQLQTHDREQAAKQRELENQVDTKLQAQASELKSLKTRTNETENQVESLRRDRAVRQVAFSASLMESGSGTIGPFSTYITLEFKHVVSNIGQAYSPHTGLFIAPVRGAYNFEFYVFAGGSSHTSRVGLVKNGEHIVIAGEDQADGFSTAANGVTLVLEAGDVVFLRLAADRIIHDNSNHYSTFSGHLLFPM